MDCTPSGASFQAHVFLVVTGLDAVVLSQSTNTRPSLVQADLSLMDVKLGEPGQRYRLPLYLDVKGQRIDTGLGHLEVRLR